MTDKVQKNKIADILLDFYDEYHSNEINRPMIPSIYAGKILDSLKEEPVSVWHNMDEVPIKGEVILVQTKDTFYGVSVQKGGTTYKNKNKDRYVKWAYASDLLNLSSVERTVKNWKEEPVSEDFEEAANNYCVNVRKGYPRVKDETDRYICNAFKAGTQWQKQKDEHLIWQISSANYEKGKQKAREEMVKDAVDAQVVLGPNNNHVLMNGLFNNYKYHDIVKLIIIKED